MKEKVRKILENKDKTVPILSFPSTQLLGISVKELIASSDKQLSGMKAIADRCAVGASLNMMDLSVEAEAFGATVRFAAEEVPAIVGQLISDEDDANDLEVPDLTAGRALLCVEAVRTAKQRITNKPVLAGMNGPYSLAGRLCDVTEIMYLCFDEPETVHTVLDKVTKYLIQYGQAMKDVGADGLMMAEPLAGILSPDMAEEFSMPYVKRIIDALQDDDFAVIYHNCGNSVPQMLDGIYQLGASAYHFGNAIDLEAVMKVTPADILVMGNVDPAGQICNGTPESVKEATRKIMAACSYAPNFCISTGCDIPPMSPWTNIDAFFEAAAE